MLVCLAEGLHLRTSRGDKTAFELFERELAVWSNGLEQLLVVV